MTKVTAPQQSGSRDQVRELIDQLPEDLTNSEVQIDFGHTFVATPSFMDQLVLEVLVNRHAHRLTIANTPERARTYAERAAENRGVADRLQAA